MRQTQTQRSEMAARVAKVHLVNTRVQRRYWCCTRRDRGAGYDAAAGMGDGVEGVSDVLETETNTPSPAAGTGTKAEGIK